MIKSYLKKINKYPVCLPEQKALFPKRWLTGAFNFDEICSSLGNYYILCNYMNNFENFIFLAISVKKMEEQLDEEINVAILIK